MDAVVVASTSQPRSLMWLFLSFAAAALVLAAIGTYGVVSYTTAQRTFEIGVRVALGASRGSIFGLVIRQSLELVIAGVGLGAVAALALSRLLSSYLYGITPQDPLTFLAVAGLLVCIALAAGFLPARRATKVDPIVALRYE
jgi:putative ABC transport system permease protein